MMRTSWSDCGLQTAVGKPLPTLELNSNNCDDYHYSEVDDFEYGEVKEDDDDEVNDDDDFDNSEVDDDENEINDIIIIFSNDDIYDGDEVSWCTTVPSLSFIWWSLEKTRQSNHKYWEGNAV